MTPDQEQKLNEVHAAIVGNPEMGHIGLVQRVNSLEKYKKADEKFKEQLKNRIAGALLILVPAGTFLFNWAQKKLTGP